MSYLRPKKRLLTVSNHNSIIRLLPKVYVLRLCWERESIEFCTKSSKFSQLSPNCLVLLIQKDLRNSENFC